MSRHLTQQQKDALKEYLDLFEQNSQQIEGASAPMLRKRSGDALLRNLLEGKDSPVHYPNERFLYTDVAEALMTDYGLNIYCRRPCVNPAETYHCEVKGLQAATIYVHGDSVYIPDGLPQLLPEGTYLGTLKDCAEPERVRALFSDKAWEPDTSDPSNWINDMIALDGICLVVPDGVKLPMPVQIVNIADWALDMMSNRRLCIYLGRKAEADIIVCDHAYGENLQLTTSNVTLQLSEGSRLGYYSVEQTNEKTTRFCNIRAMQQSDSRLEYNSITLQCGTTRSTLTIMQPEHGAVAEVCGAVVAGKSERADNYVRVEHGGEGNSSNMLFKYVLGGKSVGAFTGEVFVAEGARQISSEQQSQNLLTTDEARVYSRPVLEIYADDVKCNHGATVGKLDETALFYMQQRGISEPDARMLLQHAFVNDVLQRISIPALREQLSTLVERRFRSGRAQCDGCRMIDLCKDN